jgi:hypothetical protein
VVHHVPQGVEQPANGDEPIVAEAAVRGEQQYATEEVLPYTEASVEVRATGPGNQDGAEIASVRFLQSRAQTNKDRGHTEWRHQMGCRKDSSCACLHRLTLGALRQPEKWRDCQLSTDSRHRLSYAPAVKNVVILALDGVLPFDLATPLEVFGRARLQNGQSAYQVRICAPSRTVDAGALSLHVPWALNIMAEADTIIVPGRAEPTAPVPEDVLAALRTAASRATRVASICVGAFTLAAAGLLDGLRATQRVAGFDLSDRISRSLQGASGGIP